MFARYFPTSLAPEADVEGVCELLNLLRVNCRQSGLFQSLDVILMRALEKLTQETIRILLEAQDLVGAILEDNC